MTRSTAAHGRQRLGSLSLSLVLVAACTAGGSEPTPGVETEATAGSTTAQGTTAQPDTATEGTATTAAPTSDESTAADGTTASDTMPATDTGVMPPVPKSCALEVIDPAADPAMVIDAGDAAGQIPTSVGAALLRNCGCHYTDDVPIGLYVDYVSNAQPMATLADFHADFMGTFPMGFEQLPAYMAVEERVVHSNPLPMPPFGCGVEGEPGPITAADLQLLGDWLSAAAPDGASFP